MQIRTYRLKWTKYTCCWGKSDWGFNDKKWVPTASMLWVWPAGLRQVQQQGMNAHQGAPKCSKSIGMFRSREASKSISYFSNLARDCSIPENCSLWQIQFSTWCLHGNLPPVSKSLRLRKNFFSSYFNHSSAFWLVLCSQMPESREEKPSYAPPPPFHYETTQ